MLGDGGYFVVIFCVKGWAAPLNLERSLLDR